LLDGPPLQDLQREGDAEVRDVGGAQRNFDCVKAVQCDPRVMKRKSRLSRHRESLDVYAALLEREPAGIDEALLFGAASVPSVMLRTAPTMLCMRSSELVTVSSSIASRPRRTTIHIVRCACVGFQRQLRSVLWPAPIALIDIPKGFSCADA
jgi:hypothetical protein